MLSGAAETQEKSTEVFVDRNLIPEGATQVKSWFKPSLRETLKIVIVRETVKTEQVSFVLNGEEKVICANTVELGPRNAQVTFQGISSVIMLCLGSALPTFRVARMIGNAGKIYSSTNICRWLSSLAASLSFLYLYYSELLSDAPVINMDDTNTRCIEMENNASLEDQKLCPLASQMEATLGRKFPKKNGKGLKNGLFVTHATSEVDTNFGPASIHFFRTHYGSGGNLLDKLLEQRSPKNKTLYLQSDMSSQNRASKVWYSLFNIINAGCAAHARRPFWRYQKQDPELCDYMLKAFLLLAWVERRGKETGKIIYYRQKYAAKIWELINLRAAEVVKFTPRNKRIWPVDSEIYKACKYLVKNYSALTRYLLNPNLKADNNICERMLRSEKMLLVSCKFRKTEQGRITFDILRTIVMTAKANRVSLMPYLDWIQKNQAKIEQNPEMFTPWAYKAQMDSKTKMAA